MRPIDRWLLLAAWATIIGIVGLTWARLGTVANTVTYSECWAADQRIVAQGPVLDIAVDRGIYTAAEADAALAAQVDELHRVCPTYQAPLAGGGDG